jgi:hypothetical protein
MANSRDEDPAAGTGAASSADEVIDTLCRNSIKKSHIFDQIIAAESRLKQYNQNPV